MPIMTLNVEIPETVVVDKPNRSYRILEWLGKLGTPALTYIVLYGVRQALADAAAPVALSRTVDGKAVALPLPEMDEARERANALIVARMNALLAGKVPTSGGGGRMMDPVLRELRAIYADATNRTFADVAKVFRTFEDAQRLFGDKYDKAHKIATKRVKQAEREREEARAMLADSMLDTMLPEGGTNTD